MIKEEIRTQILAATKSKLEVQKNVLKVVLGEIDTQESRSNKPFTDDDCIRTVKKVLQGVEEMLTYSNEAKFQVERDTLKALLPKEITLDDLKAILASKVDDLRVAKNEGQAMGMAMKFLKEKGIVADGNLVKKFVTDTRS